MTSKPLVSESLRREQNGYLETIGRVSGQPRVTEIWFVAEDDRIYLLSGYHNNKDWVRNLTKTPRVRFRIGDRWYSGTARIIDSDPKEGECVRIALATKYYGGDLSGGDNWATTGTPFAIDLDIDAADESAPPVRPVIDNTPRTGFIETTGRTSGKPRETQIGFATDGVSLFMISSRGTGTDWVKNLLRNPGVRFRIGETWHAGTAHLARGEGEIATVRRAMVAKYADRGRPTAWIETGLPVVIDLDPESR